ncbi:MAG: class I SAM-dependent rRNA methyltransferase [Lachnospiraceae bacterium]|nr:class I SAM-dependent rRNA methyltransferase [Lachnospiraceae bacterium]
MNKKAIIKKGEGRYLKKGGLWLYDNEISELCGDITDGETVEVEDFDGFFMGVGFVNRASKIMIRMLTRRTHIDDIDALIRERVKDAWEHRKRVVDTSSCRVIFAESDYLPGIVIDKFEDILVVESLALGIDLLKGSIISAVKEILAEDGILIRGVYERSESNLRRLEGMKPFKGFIGKEFDNEIEIIENGVKYIVDVMDGQKTGFFLDQKYNRQAAGRLCKGAKVLDCFTHTGSFALNAAKCGAESVLGLDISQFAIDTAKRNAVLNGLEDKVSFHCTDVFEELPRLLETGERFDVVILDPPAFTKSRDSVKNAVKGYKEINLRGMKLLKDKGYLCTCTCSHFMDSALFLETVHKAAKDAHKRLRLVEQRAQSPDHPIVLGMEESSYLKFLIFQVYDEK